MPFLKKTPGKFMGKDSDASKPSLAIAFAANRAIAPKKMANGGQVNPSLQQSHMEPCEHGGPDTCAMGCYAEGGMIPGMKENYQGMSMADAVMAKRKAKMMADGGMVDDDDQEPGNNFDELSEMAFEKGDYEAPEASSYSEDGETGDEDEKARGSLVSRIMSKRKKGF